MNNVISYFCKNPRSLTLSFFSTEITLLNPLFVQNQLSQAQCNQDLIEEEEYYESVSHGTGQVRVFALFSNSSFFNLTIIEKLQLAGFNKAIFVVFISPGKRKSPTRRESLKRF